MNLAYLRQQIEPVRNNIIQHPLYNRLETLEHLQLFTRNHVFAVWDFMSLLKSLQYQLTCVTTPWRPTGNAATRYLINEIVTGEESDVDARGQRISHFELYLQAMQQMGADTTPIEQLLLLIDQGVPVKQAMLQIRLPADVIEFCSFTFDLIEKAPVHVQAAVFTFGREDLIPDMFHQLVVRLSARYPQQLDTFRYYLERHIEVDGDHHSQLALAMVEELCGTDADKWVEASNASVLALLLRYRLWSTVLTSIDSAANADKILH